MRQLLLLLVFVSTAYASDMQRDWQRAIDRDDGRTIERLLASVDPTLRNEKGKTALMVAAKIGDHALLDDLRAAGLSTATRSYTGGTALMYAVLGNQVDMARRLLGLDQDTVNASSTNGWTALMIACAKGFPEMARLLVDSGADPNIDDAYLWSPLMRAIDNRHKPVIRYLLALPQIDVEHRNENRATALHVAASIHDIETVRLLLGLGASPDFPNAKGQTPIDIARVNGDAAILQLLEATSKP